MAEKIDRAIHLLSLPKIHESLLPRSGVRAMTGNLDLAGNKLLTTNLLLKEKDANALAVRNLADTDYKWIQAIRVNTSEINADFWNTLSIKARGIANCRIYMYDGNGNILIHIENGNVILPNLPVADPHVVGALWNDGGIVKVSSG